MPDIKLSTLSGIYLLIGTLVDDKINNGNGDKAINEGDEKELYDKTIETINGNIFEFNGFKMMYEDEDKGDETSEKSIETTKWMYDTNFSNKLGHIKGVTNEFDSKILSYSKTLKLDPNIVKAIMIVESWGDPNATSNKDCRGLMQVNSLYFKGVDLYDVDTNINLGCNILKKHIMNYNGDISKALLAYNRGAKNANAAMKKENFVPENDSYVKNVQKYYNLLTNKKISVTA